MVLQTAFELTLDCLTSKPVVVVTSADQISSDAGLLPFLQLDERIGLTRQFVDALTDRRHAGYIGHTFLEMTRARIFGILADYVDQNDHDMLRSDPIFKLICGRSIEDDDLASQPTLSRFENAIERSVSSPCRTCSSISLSPRSTRRRGTSRSTSTRSTIPLTASSN